MPDIRCSECGHYVRVQGLAATCPHCGNLLFANQQETPAPLDPTVASNASSGFLISGTDPILDASLVEPDPSLPPPPQPMQVIAVDAGKPIEPWKLIVAAVALLLALIVGVDWLRLRATRNPPVVI